MAWSALEIPIGKHPLGPAGYGSLLDMKVTWTPPTLAVFRQVMGQEHKESSLAGTQNYVAALRLVRVSEACPQCRLWCDSTHWDQVVAVLSCRISA